MRRRLTWLAFGLLLAGAAIAYPRLRAALDPPMDSLSPEFRQVVREVGFVDETRVKELSFENLELRQELARVSRTKITGTVEIREVPVEVPGPERVVEIPGPRVVVQGAGPPCELERMSLGGSCTTEMMEGHGDRLARVLWSGQAAWSLQGRPGTSSRGPIVAEEIRFETTGPPAKRYWPRLEARVGRHTESGWDLGVTYSPWHRRPFLGRVALYAGYQSGDESEVFIPESESYVRWDDSRAYGGVALRF